MEELKKQCWVCFATEDDDICEYYQIPAKTMKHQWIRPCKCKGTTKWVHHSCLKRWIDEKQKGNQSEPVTCPQCKFKYMIMLPDAGALIFILERIEKLIQRLCPFIAAGIIVGTIYWTAVTYGAVTIMQVMGHQDGLYFIETTDPIFLLVGLPTIPVCLILSKMLRWENLILDLWRRHSTSLHTGFNQLLYTITSPQHNFSYDTLYNLDSTQTTDDNLPFTGINFINEGAQSTTPLFDNINTSIPDNNGDATVLSYDHSTTRILCGALMLPSIAVFVGRLFAPSYFQTNLEKTIFGGLSFLAVKGIVHLYYRQTQFQRSQNRLILNYKSPPVTPNAVYSSTSLPRGGGASLSLSTFISNANASIQNLLHDSQSEPEQSSNTHFSD